MIRSTSDRALKRAMSEALSSVAIPCPIGTRTVFLTPVRRRSASRALSSPWATRMTGIRRPCCIALRTSRSRCARLEAAQAGTAGTPGAGRPAGRVLRACPPRHRCRPWLCRRGPRSARLSTARLGRPGRACLFSEPMVYMGADSELDVSSYLKRPYAPLGGRLAALRRPLAGYAGYLEAARDNLEASLPRPNLEIAIEAAAGQADYLDGEVRTAAAGDADTIRAIDRAVLETREAVAFLKQRQRDAHDRFALGEERFLRLLQTREMVPLNVSELERLVRADIERNMAAAERAAEAISPGRGVGAALRDLEEHTPPTDSIIV